MQTWKITVVEWYYIERWKQFKGWVWLVGGDQPSRSDNESDLNNRAEGSKYRDLLNKKLKRLLCFCCNAGWSIVDYWNYVEIEMQWFKVIQDTYCHNHILKGVWYLSPFYFCLFSFDTVFQYHFKFLHFCIVFTKEIQMMAQSGLGAKENCAIADEKWQNALPTPNWTCGEGWVKYVPCCQWEYFDNQTFGNRRAKWDGWQYIYMVLWQYLTILFFFILDESNCPKLCNIE